MNSLQIWLERCKKVVTFGEWLSLLTWFEVVREVLGVLGSPALLCHKEPARASKAPRGGFGNILLAPRWFFLA